MNLSLIERDAASLTPQGRQSLADAQAQIETCGRELRELSHALFPTLLGSAGLGPALRWLGRLHGEARLRLALQPLPRYDVSVELAAYRLVEDAIARLYAEGAAVTGRVTSAVDVLEVTLEGQPRAPGGDPVEMALRQRVRSVGGRFRMRSSGGLLRIEVRFPPSAPDMGG
jgi:signal transduction histidine kinase